MIELINLSVRFGLYHLHEVTASIESGEYFVVTGPAGSGKTVLVETIIGLNTAYRGRILLDGVNVRGVPVEARSIAYVPQDHGIFPHLSVQANLFYGAREHGFRRDELTDELDELLDLFDLRGVLTRTKAAGLSAGEQQRIAIARALLSRPAVLVLDEPMAHLDAPVRREMMLRLKRIKEASGVTIIHATRDLDEALALGTRVAVIIAGRVHQTARPEARRLRPVDAPVARWMAGRNVFPAAVRSTDSVRTTDVVQSAEGAAGTAVVACGELELVGTYSGARPSTGMAVLVGFRPQEAWLLADGESPAQANVLEGTVESLLAYGSTDTLVVRVEKLGQQVEVAVPGATAARHAPVEGSSVRIAVPHGALWLVERD